MMSIRDWLKQNAELINCEYGGRQWVTKMRGDYITLEGMESKLSYLVERGITENVASIWEAGKPISIGFNPVEQKWYGWSHRAIYGFGIGSTCKRGDCHYRPTDKDDFLQDCMRFWADDLHNQVRAEHCGDHVLVEWEYSHATPNESLRGHIGGVQCPYPGKWGKGEWVAESLADARQMAVDFADSVA
ncbi:hypothetical protein [Spongiibacter sp.]|uniref:hypothetical protein n=1 Tax=Spongiibacter sp. TaxID=2024860 RepID=UPI000C3F2FD6|nr:hypothetical protein [Spongiibacter sp.]MBU71856.1 hypothetical protein [Spongiibacter sp.]HCP19602.1 hypothetical protein [Marinobacter nauticus]|tara:strand:- start:26520 stop:27083 length:564 start_codon:yes stop_codon:yes gene_type:complete